MAKFRSKKLLGIPVSLILTLALLAMPVLAYYVATSISSTTEVVEVISATSTQEFAAELEPGGTNTWTFDIANSGGQAYSIKADLAYTDSDGTSSLNTTQDGENVDITEFTFDGSDGLSDLLDDGSIEALISAGGSLSASLNITAEGDAAPGTVTVELELSRE